MRTSNRFLVVMSAALAASAGCSLVLGIQDVTQRQGTGGSGGVQPSSSSSGAAGGTTSSSGTTMSSSSSGAGGSDAGPACDPATRWPIVISSTLTPPNHLMGLDLSGGVDGGYLTYAQAVALNCDGADAGGLYPGGGGVAWGDAGQAQFYYDITTGKYEFATLSEGYTGTVTWTSANHTYVAQLGKQILKDGQPFQIDWNGTGDPDAGITPQQQLDAEITELYNGLVATFGVGVPQAVNCRAEGTCLQSPDDGTPQHQAAFGARPIDFYFVFSDAKNPQPTPSITTAFYTFAKRSWNDWNQAAWTAFDTTKVNAAAKGFQGVEFDGRYLYLVPNASGALVTQYDTSSPLSFTDPAAAWKTFDTVANVDPSAKSFSGGCSDGQNVYFAPSKNGVVTQYDSTATFTLPSSWAHFDTTTLSPPASQFAGCVFAGDTGAVLFVPAANGVVAVYNSYGGAFNDPAQWSSFDLTTINANLTQFHGGASSRKPGSFQTRKWIYLAPHGAGPSFPGLAARWDSSQTLDTGWETTSLSNVDPSLAGYLAYDGMISDDARYIYYVPAKNNTSLGGDVIRYDTTQAFDTTISTAWSFYHFNQVNFTTGGSDGRYMYFSGSNSTITRFDTTGIFTDYHAWDFFDAQTVNTNATAFFGTACDGRYMYFVPDTFSTLVRLDAAFPPQSLGGPRQNSFY